MNDRSFTDRSNLDRHIIQTVTDLLEVLPWNECSQIRKLLLRNVLLSHALKQERTIQLMLQGQVAELQRQMCQPQMLETPPQGRTIGQ